MSFLRNDAINRVNLQSGVQALAQHAGHVFLLVFLLRAGVPAPLTLLAQAAIVAGRFAVRPLLIPLAARIGLKPLFVIGALGMAVQYPILAQVDGLGWPLVWLCVAASLGEVFYYMAFNAYFAAVGDPEHRGSQASVREALAALAQIGAPLAGAWGLVTVGPRWTFAAVAVVQALSVIPLLGAPNVAVKREARGVMTAARPAALLIAADGWFDACFFFVWQIALFVSLGESLAAYGGAMALAGLVGAGFALVLGRHVDAGHGRRAAAIAYAAAAGVVVVRAASLTTPWMAVIANAAGALVMPLLVPPLVAATSNLARASPCPLRFGLATEGGWDIGCFIACLVVAALTALKAPLWIGVALGLPGALAGYLLLVRLYPRKA